MSFNTCSITCVICKGRRWYGEAREMKRRSKVCGIPQYILYDNENDDDNYTLRIERMKKADVLTAFASTVGW